MPRTPSRKSDPWSRGTVKRVVAGREEDEGLTSLTRSMAEELVLSTDHLEWEDHPRAPAPGLRGHPRRDGSSPPGEGRGGRGNRQGAWRHLGRGRIRHRIQQRGQRQPALHPGAT